MGETGPSKKDNWDRAEIIGKILTGLAVPIVLAVIAFFVNGQINERSRAAEMTRIAIGILQSPPGELGYDDSTLELRRWAVEVLRNPSGDHDLSDNAAQVLSENPFSGGWAGSGAGGWPEFLEELSQAFSEAEASSMMRPVEALTRRECAAILSRIDEFEQATRNACVAVYPDLAESFEE